MTIKGKEIFYMKKIKLIAAGLAASTMVLASCGNDHVHTYSDQWTSNETQHWHAATCGHDVCDGLANHHDDIKDHKCDDCGYVMSTCVDNNNDHKCDICGKDLPYVSSVTISGAPEEMARGTSVTLKANVQTHSGASNSVTWSVNDASLASITAGGVLTAKANGTVTVTATSTVDSSKKDSVSIKIVNPTWSDDDKEMMLYYLGEELPYFSDSFVWTDDYFEYYGCLTAEANGDKAKAAYNELKAMDGFVDEGSYYDEDYDVTEYYLSKDSAASSDYYLLFNIYYYDGLTSVDVYLELVEYDEWPTEAIANKMTELELDGVVPAFDAGEDAGYTASLQQLEDGTPCVYITVTDYDEESTLGAADYVAALNPDNYMISVDEYDEYFVRPNDKSYTMIVYDLQSYYYYGFEIIVCDYIPDESIAINEGFDLIAVGSDLQLTLSKGIDVSDETIVTFKSSDDAIATVTAEGKVTGVSQGQVVISALVGEEVVSEAVFYILNEVKDGWSEADKTEFGKVHAGLGDMIPFSKYFDSVSYDEDMCQVDASSSFYSYEFENYYNALIEAGWTDTLTESIGDLAPLAYAFGYPYTFEKEVVISETSFWVTIELTCINTYQEDEESEIEYFYDYEGYLNISVYDDYIYTYSDAVSAIKSELAYFEVETTADFPEALPASHYYVGYDADYNDIDFIAYDVTGITIDDVVSALNEKNWDVEKLHQDSYVDEESGETVEAYDFIGGTSADGVLELEGYVEDGMVILYMYLPSTEVLDTLTIDDLLPDVTKATVYTDFADVEGDSGAVYAGQCALSDDSHGNCIQIRSKNSNSGIYSAESAGTVCSITIYFDEANTSTNQIKIVASNEPFESTEDLYTATVVGTVTDEEGVGYYEFEEEYAYFGIISANGAFYIDSIEVVWLA